MTSTIVLSRFPEVRRIFRSGFFRLLLKICRDIAKAEIWYLTILVSLFPERDIDHVMPGVLDLMTNKFCRYCPRH